MRDALVPHLAADAQQTSSAAQPIDESVAIIHTIPEKNLARVIDYLPLTSRVNFMVDKRLGREVLDTTDTVQLIARLMELGVSEFNILNLIRSSAQATAKLTLLKLLEKAELITNLVELNNSWNAVTGRNSACEYLRTLSAQDYLYLIKGNINRKAEMSVKILKIVALSGVNGAFLGVDKKNLASLSYDKLENLTECAAYSGNLENFNVSYQWLKDRRGDYLNRIKENDKWRNIFGTVVLVSFVSLVALMIASIVTSTIVGEGVAVNVLMGFACASLIVLFLSGGGVSMNEPSKNFIQTATLLQHDYYLKHAALSGDKKLFTYLLTESNGYLNWYNIKDYALKGGNGEIIKILNEKIAANPRVGVSNINANRMVATSEARRAWAAENRLRSQNRASLLVNTLWGSSAGRAVAATDEPQGTVADAVRRGLAN